jgi:tetratricopeptide (TPR) repeat protein
MEPRRRTLVAAFLAAACLLVFGQAVHCDFLNFDDNGYVTDNPNVRAGLTAAGVRWAFTTVDYFYWQPLTFLSHMLDCQLFGLRPGGHHLVNVLLHAANAVLAFAVLLALTGALWRSAAAAALFAVHPLRVESVVWIAERKDVLSAFLFLAAIWWYVRYVKRPSRAGYYLMLLAFVLGLMAKPMVMTLPFLLLALDWWPLKRRAFSEKLPMICLSLLSVLVTSIATARLGAINWGASLSLQQRIANTLISYVRYLELSFWPHDLAILYPYRLAVPWWQAAAAALVLIAITLAALWQARRRPYLIVGWLWFTFVLLPAAGLLQVGRQGMADRFTYLPHIGLAIAVVWGVSDILAARPRAAGALAVAAIAVLAASAWMQVRFWRDSATVFGRAVAVTGDNPMAQHFLAAGLDDQGRYIEAMPHHAEAVRLEPSYFVAQCAYGAALENAGEHELAIEHFRAALRYYPDYSDAKQQLEAAQKKLDLSKGSWLKLNSGR